MGQPNQSKLACYFYEVEILSLKKKTELVIAKKMFTPNVLGPG